MASILVIMLKEMQNVDGLVNLPLLARLQFVPTLTRTITTISSLKVMSQGCFLIAHIARDFDVRPTQFVIMVFVSTLERDFR